MPDTSPDTTTDARQPYQLSYVIRLTIASAFTAGVAGFAVADMIALSQVAKWLPRAVLTVAALVLIVWVAEIRVSRQLARNEAHLATRLDEVEAQMAERLDRIEEHLKERLREAAHAEGYLAGIQHREAVEADSHHLRSVR